MRTYTNQISFSPSTNQQSQLLGAAEARRAHNPEDLGSKPRAAIFLRVFLAWGVGLLSIRDAVLTISDCGIGQAVMSNCFFACVKGVRLFLLRGRN
jgi:hypothetical protein